MILKFIPFLFGAVVVFFSTPWGLGLSVDSISYATASRGLAEHGDFMGLPSHWPPLYPILLAVFQTLAGDPILAGRFLHTLLFALNGILLVLLFHDEGKKSVLFLLFPILIVLQPDFVAVHLYLWSEPTFIALMLTNLLLLKHMIAQDVIPPKYFFFLALTTGLAIMARYAGLFLVLVNTVAILLFMRLPATRFWMNFSEKWSFPGRLSGNVLHRLWLAGMVGVLSLVPMGAWSLFNVLRGSKAANREIVWHPPGWQHLVQANATLADWFHLPRDFGWAAILLVFMGVVWAFSHGVRAWRDGDFKSRSLVPLYGLFIFVYIAFLLASISLADYHTPLSGRILVPILPVVMALMAQFLLIVPGRRASLLLLGLVMSLTALNVSKSFDLMGVSKESGMGFANRNIQEMQIIDTLGKLPSGWKVFTNGPEFFSLYLPQGGTMFPRKLHPGTQLDNEHYSMQMGEMRSTADALVYFTGMRYRYYLPEASELNGQEGFQLLYSQADGAIWVRDEIIREHAK